MKNPLRSKSLAWLTGLLVSLSLCASANPTPTVLNRGNGAEPDSLHPHQAQGLGSQNILRDVCEGLLTVAASGKPAPGVASSWRISDDGRQWDFTLRPDARWEDGSPVRAADFVAAWRAAVAPRTQAHQAGLFDVIENAEAIRRGQLAASRLGVTAVDDRHLRVRLNRPEAGLPELLSLPLFCPLHPAALTSTALKSGGRKPISNGAYRLLEWVPQEKIVLEKNPHFHDADSVAFARVIYRVTEDPASELKRFRAGELDITETIPDNQIDWIRQHLPQNLRIFPYLGTFFLGLNTDHAPLDNAALREALFWAIDRDILTRKVLKSGQQPAYQLIPPPMGAGAGSPPDSRPPFVDWSAQLAYARKQLAESGFKPQTAEPLEILYNSSANQRKVALAVAAMWRQNLGIRSRLRNVEWKVFVHERKKPERQVFRSGWIADVNDPLDFLRLFSSDSPNNYYHYRNPRFDALLGQIRLCQGEQRQQLIGQAERLLLADVPVIPLYFYVSRHLLSDRIGGYVDNVADRHLSRYLHDKTRR